LARIYQHQKLNIFERGGTHVGGSGRIAKLMMTRLTGPSPEYRMAFDTKLTST